MSIALHMGWHTDSIVSWSSNHFKIFIYNVFIGCFRFYLFT